MKITTVLLVDDKPGNPDLIADMLKRNDRHPSHLHSVADGMGETFLHCKGVHANPLPFHLTVLDLNIPPKGGQVFLAEVKSDPAPRDTPIAIFRTSTARDHCKQLSTVANSDVSKRGDLSGLASLRNSDRRFLPGRERTT